MDPCSHPLDGHARRRVGSTHVAARVPASRGAMHPYRPLDRSMGIDRYPRAPEGYIPPSDADAHDVSWIQASVARDVPIHESRTPIRSHGYGQAVARPDRSHASRTAMRPHGRSQAEARAAPFACCGRPWALMAYPFDAKGAPIRVKARGHGVRAIHRRDGKGAPLRGPRAPMGPHRRATRPKGRGDPRRRPLASGSSMPASTARLSRSARWATCFAGVGVPRTT